ncbi:hypothetical protein BB559_001538 [Furculomyces boomerangus]|uniref:Uncharacterized protein n=1 Tax=Furculomyces boomerangus TaxID=61424 RepID=A0A2T9Z1Q2_9FUNG|nr:hypothetical protein BB559_001538 [Furculomyces boomerangus]
MEVDVPQALTDEKFGESEIIDSNTKLPDKNENDCQTDFHVDQIQQNEHEIVEKQKDLLQTTYNVLESVQNEENESNNNLVESILHDPSQIGTEDTFIGEDFDKWMEKHAILEYPNQEKDQEDQSSHNLEDNIENEYSSDKENEQNTLLPVISSENEELIYPDGVTGNRSEQDGNHINEEEPEEESGQYNEEEPEEGSEESNEEGSEQYNEGGSEQYNQEELEQYSEEEVIELSSGESDRYNSDSLVDPDSEPEFSQDDQTNSSTKYNSEDRIKSELLNNSNENRNGNGYVKKPNIYGNFKHRFNTEEHSESVNNQSGNSLEEYSSGVESNSEEDYESNNENECHLEPKKGNKIQMNGDLIYKALYEPDLVQNNNMDIEEYSSSEESGDANSDEFEDNNKNNQDCENISIVSESNESESQYEEMDLDEKQKLDSASELECENSEDKDKNMNQFGENYHKKSDETKRIYANSRRHKIPFPSHDLEAIRHKRVETDKIIFQQNKMAEEFIKDINIYMNNITSSANELIEDLAIFSDMYESNLKEVSGIINLFRIYGLDSEIINGKISEYGEKANKSYIQSESINTEIQLKDNMEIKESFELIKNDSNNDPLKLKIMHDESLGGYQEIENEKGEIEDLGRELFYIRKVFEKTVLELLEVRKAERILETENNDLKTSKELLSKENEDLKYRVSQLEAENLFLETQLRSERNQKARSEIRKSVGLLDRALLNNVTGNSGSDFGLSPLKRNEASLHGAQEREESKIKRPRQSTIRETISFDKSIRNGVYSYDNQTSEIDLNTSKKGNVGFYGSSSNTRAGIVETRGFSTPKARVEGNNLRDSLFRGGAHSINRFTGMKGQEGKFVTPEIRRNIVHETRPEERDAGSHIRTSIGGGVGSMQSLLNHSATRSASGVGGGIGSDRRKTAISGNYRAYESSRGIIDKRENAVTTPRLFSPIIRKRQFG